MNNDLPETEFLSSVFLCIDGSPCLVFEILDFDLLSRTEFAILNETPPNMKPVVDAGRVCVTLKASTNIEKVDVAIKTPLPKAIIVVMTLCGKLTNTETTHQISRGLEAINPIRKDSNTPTEVGILCSHLTLFVIHTKKNFISFL
jgi:hypothetical protein